jgi:isopenicillin N synthase-like dioxygenase
MVEMKHRVLLEATKATFAIAFFIAFNVDEIITIDNT